VPLLFYIILIDESTTHNPTLLADHGDQKNGEWRQMISSIPLPSQQGMPHATNWSSEAKSMRQLLLEYFNSEIGSVPWQDKMI